MYGYPATTKPITQAELESKDAQFKIDNMRADVQNMYIPKRQGIKEQSRITSAEVMQQQIQSDAQRIGMHHDVKIQKINRLQEEIVKCKKHIKNSKRAIKWSWGLFPVSLACGIFFPPTYFRTKKRHYVTKMESAENQILALTHIDNLISSYTHSDLLHSKDTDVRGQNPNPTSTVFFPQPTIPTAPPIILQTQ